MKVLVAIAIGCVLWAADTLLSGTASAQDASFADLCVDRTAIERVYYSHRLGTKPPFEEIVTKETIEHLVKLDLKKEEILKKHYGVEVTREMEETEVQRIERSTRSPEILSELETSLGEERQRFMRTVARPIIVERLLRESFENDEKLHSKEREKAERARMKILELGEAHVGMQQQLDLLRGDYSNYLSCAEWHLGKRKSQTAVLESKNAESLAQSTDYRGAKPSGYLSDLPPALQRVLTELKQRGDVSAVIEMPDGFLVHVATERTSDTLKLATIAIPKRSYEQWLAEGQ